MTIRRGIFGLGLTGLLCAAVAGCGGGGSSDIQTGTGTGSETVVSTVLSGAAPNAFSNQVYFYNNTGVTQDTTAVVFLHGGAGTNTGMAQDLGIDTGAGAPTASTVNWDWANTHGVLMVFPQGAGLDGTGTATWSNWVMTSGQDDEAFLQALVNYIKTNYPTITRVFLAGHSNGGMMANRMWCESADTFDGYIAFSGPASQHYLAQPSDCLPMIGNATAKPYFAVVGGNDNVLDDSSFTAATWTIDPSYVAGSTQGSFVNPVLIGEFAQDTARAAILCPGESFDYTSPTQSSGSNIKTWSCGGGRLQLQLITNANHSINDSFGLRAPGLQKASGEQLIDLVWDFISGLPSS